MSALQSLQQALFELAVTPDPAPFVEGPEAWARTRGLTPADARAFETQAARLLVYRDLVRFALEDPLPDAYPITHRLLTEAGAWEEAVSAFLAAGSLRSTYYREVAPAFLAWVAETGWGTARWPFLLALLHWELLELELQRHPDLPPPVDLEASPTPASRVVPDPTLRNLTYPWAVQEATEADPVPKPTPTHLLAWRDGQGDFQSLALSPSASSLLARWLDGEPLADAAAELGVALGEAAAFATTLKAREALLGFR